MQKQQLGKLAVSENKQNEANLCENKCLIFVSASSVYCFTSHYMKKQLVIFLLLPVIHLNLLVKKPSILIFVLLNIC